MTEIEKGVTIPQHRHQYGKSKYPFMKMEVGDSFFVTTGNSTPARKQSALTSRALQVSKKFGGRFSVRKVTENGVTGYRVWRVA